MWHPILIYFALFIMHSFTKALCLIPFIAPLFTFIHNFYILFIFSQMHKCPRSAGHFEYDYVLLL